MINTEKIKLFVQKTLRCGCPEEVFQFIDCQADIEINNILINRKLNIGNRLLIYIVEIESSDIIQSILPVLVDAGRNERDRMHFNRFRLVLGAKKINEVKKIARDLFEKLNIDEKVYLHVVPHDEVPVCE